MDLIQAAHDRHQAEVRMDLSHPPLTPVSILGVMPYGGRDGNNRPIPNEWTIHPHVYDPAAPKAVLWAHGTPEVTGWRVYKRPGGTTLRDFPTREAALAAAGYVEVDRG